MSMFVYKGERGVKNALNSVYVVCTQPLTSFNPTNFLEILCINNMVVCFGKLSEVPFLNLDILDGKVSTVSKKKK